MNCSNPYLLVNENYPQGLECPCRKCIACNIKKATEWAIRIQMERAEYNSACFLTLTYKNERLPRMLRETKTEIRKSKSQIKKGHEYEKIIPITKKWDEIKNEELKSGQPTLDENEISNFIKRLRKHLKKKKIKYYGCGEYGDQTYRPHYHIIIFGIDYRDIETTVEMDNKRFVTGGSVHKAWQENGKINIGSVTPETAQYVAGYLLKKQKEYPKEFYEDKGIIAPYFRASKGLGLENAIKNKIQIKENKYIIFQNKKRPIPTYIRDKLEVDKEPLIEIAIKNNLRIMEHHMKKLKEKGIESVAIPDFNRHKEILNNKENYKKIREELKIIEENITSYQKYRKQINESRKAGNEYLKERTRKKIKRDF